MRWILTLIVVVALYVVDREYLDGQNAALVSSLLHSVGAFISEQVDNLLRPLRR
jgi:hypothetical protein